MQGQSQQVADPTRALRAAVAAGERERVAALLADAGGRVGRRVIDRLAGDAMRAEQWAVATTLLEHAASRSAEGGDVEARLRLCRNLASIQAHRPTLHETLTRAPQASECTVQRARDGRPTLVQALPGEQPTCLTPGLDVEGAQSAALTHLAPAQEQGLPVALLGVGDGYVLDALAREPAELPHGQQQPVFVLEPDPEVLLACLMLHDYTGPTGPIEQARFHWAVGPAAGETLRHWLESDPGLYPPMRTITQSVRAAALEQAVSNASDWVNQTDDSLKCRVHERYAPLSRDALVARLRGTGDRPARVLLLTSRFTSVLQHATRDAAAGFEAHGCETRVLIEPSTHTRLTPRMILEALLEFEPDAVFQIDHLRYELPGLFPPALPFVCWVQDNVASLTSTTAGESIGPRDFVLTSAIQLYTETYQYPARQCIYLNKLTRRVELPESWESDGEDVVFVSHGSREPQALAAELTDLVPDDNGKRLMATACRAILDAYERGGCVTTTFQVDELLAAAERDTGVRVRDAKLRRGLVQNLFDTLNNTLYRQQTLAWVTAVAEEMGLSVGLYGQGWEAHPRFARWARGPVEYGEPLERLTRRSRICLQIVPYGCLHQRLLDGLIAGGFFLVRLYEPEMVYERMMRFIRQRVPGEARDYHEAMAQMDEAGRCELAAHWQAWSRYNGGREVTQPTVDPVRRLRRHERDGTEHLLELPPRLEEVGFTDRPSLEARLRRFIAEPALRRELAEVQRRFVAAHHTYDTGLARVMRTVAETIDHETAPQPDAPPSSAPPDTHPAASAPASTP